LNGQISNPYNPYKKEPKLSRARKIPEWEHYDTEIANFSRKLMEEGLIRSRISSADVNVLANEGSTPPRVALESESEGLSKGRDEDKTRDEL
jgi:UDP-glucose:glycoprotein glucosyltransferase